MPDWSAADCLTQLWSFPGYGRRDEGSIVRAGVLALVGGGIALLATTVPAAAFDSGSDPDTYYQSVIGEVDNHRADLSVQGTAFQSVDGFSRRLPDDSFDDLILAMVNRFRSDRGLPGYEQLEELRAQSAMWANRMADTKNGYLADPWYRTDAQVACSTVEDIYTVSSFTQGTPQDVFNNWAADPGTVNAILMPGSTWVGIATVDDGETQWTTMRVVRGTCPGSSSPSATVTDTLPRPTLAVAPSKDGSVVQVKVDRSGNSQIAVELQTLVRGRWLLWQKLYTEPDRQKVSVDPPAGQYRAVVPPQSGYGVVIGPTLTLS